ncbi:MAG: hypothetical protein ACRD0G_14080, partial [Acidimicrobiales bacterium]
PAPSPTTAPAQIPTTAPAPSPTTAPAQPATTAPSAPGPSASPVTLTVTNPGDAAQAVDLTPVYTVGSTSRFETSETLTGQIGFGSPVDATVEWTDRQHGEISAANPDGSYTQVITVESATNQVVSGPPESAELMSTELFDSITGVPIEMSYNHQNVAVSMGVSPGATATAEQQQAIAGLLVPNQATPVAYPADPVGAGATWTATHPFPWQGTTGTISVDYRLDTVSGDQWSVSYSFTVDMSQITFANGVSATGTMSETGTVTGSISSPLSGVTESTTTNAITISDGYSDNSTLTRRTVATQQS